MADDCIFCKIIKGEIPSFKIYEDDYTYAFLDIAKDMDGHTLVIPKNHCRSILECSAEDLGHVMETVQKISRHYIEDCDRVTHIAELLERVDETLVIPLVQTNAGLI